MPLDYARIRALCFDVDGTLSDTDDLYSRRISTWIGWMPLLHNPDKLARRVTMWMESPGSAMMTASDAIGIDGLVIPLVDWMYRRFPPNRKEFLVVSGVPEMLASLRQHYPLAVISARDEDSTMAFLEKCRLASNFETVVTALSARHTKPYPDPILLAAQRMGVSPEACLMIGDTAVDVRAGRAAGAQTIGVLCGFGDEAELLRAGADLILPTTADVERELLGGGGRIPR